MTLKLRVELNKSPSSERFQVQQSATRLVLFQIVFRAPRFFGARALFTTELGVERLRASTHKRGVGWHFFFPSLPFPLFYEEVGAVGSDFGA